MPDLIKTADEAEWLAARRAGVTASEIAILMGLSPYSSPYALYHQKLGLLPDQLDSAVMERGRVLEPYVVEKFAERHPEFVYDGTGRELYAHSDRPWQLATPDRLVVSYEIEWDTNGTIPVDVVAVLETKTASDMSEWGEPGTDEIPVHYRAQVLWQMDVMGVASAYVAVLDVPRWEVREYVIGHHPMCMWRDYPDGGGLVAGACSVCTDLYVMRDAARDFLGRIERQDPPDVDWRPATAAALKQLHPTVEEADVEVRRMPIIQYRAAVKAFKAAERRKKEAENRLRLLLGGGHRIVSVHTGEVIARRDVYEVGESVRKAYTVDKLVAVPPKKEKKS